MGADRVKVEEPVIQVLPRWRESLPGEGGLSIRNQTAIPETAK
jgi:hypothetical protein